MSEIIGWTQADENLAKYAKENRLEEKIADLTRQLAAKDAEIAHVKERLAQAPYIQPCLIADNERLFRENYPLRAEIASLKLIEQEHSLCKEAIDSLRAEVERLMEGLKRLEWTPCEDYCENDAHDLAGPNSADYDDMHHRSCMACGAMQCEGHKPNCWLNKLIGEGK